MNAFTIGKRAFALSLACLLVATFAACSSPRANNAASAPEQASEQQLDTSRFLVVAENEPDTVDFQCTSIYYSVAINSFDRLVATESDANGNSAIVPSLAESWEVSSDGIDYTFHLREGVTFSNGSALTSSDVLYTLVRLLTHPDSCNQDIAAPIRGASQLRSGEASELAGFREISDLDFTISLEQPFEAFLSCLSMPGVSILDEQTTEAAGDRFGKDPESTIGTGSFILKSWTPEEGMLFVANQNCWQGAPRCAGLDARFVAGPEEMRVMFENGELDILDLDEAGSSAEFFIHGDVYQDRLYQVPRIGTTYIALNESIRPLNDVRVRKALQLSLNRETLLNAVYSGHGAVENGIFPLGLYGFNPNLPEIPFSPDEARGLLAEAGYPEGFDFTISIRSSSTEREVTLMRLAASMWEDIGVRASIEVLGEDEFMGLRKSGDLACYTATWTADFNDPDNFIYTFFGTRENTVFRSLCYAKEDIMERVREARAITDSDKRLQEYHDLERIIVQEDAAWIPLFSRLRSFVVSERVGNVQFSWNGSAEYGYRDITIT